MNTLNRIFIKHLLCAVFALSALIAHAGTSAAMPIISEVFYDAVGGDDGQTFVELAGEPGESLEGLVVEGINGSGGGVTVTLELHGEIAADGLFVVADMDGGGATLVGGADLLLNFDFQNGPDSVVLRDAGGVLDAVGYGVFDGDLVFAGEGSAALDVPAGASLARFFADVDTDDNALDFGSLAMPTPGTAEFQVLPEPSSGLLAATGLLTLGWLGRRRDRAHDV